MGPCPHYDCTNRNSFGYCNTTACINPNYNHKSLTTASTVDVVEVVRCKDCKHCSLNRKVGNAYCDLGIGLYELYDYCSRGERIEDAKIR